MFKCACFMRIQICGIKIQIWFKQRLVIKPSENYFNNNKFHYQSHLQYYWHVWSIKCFVQVRNHMKCLPILVLKSQTGFGIRNCAKVCYKWTLISHNFLYYIFGHPYNSPMVHKVIPAPSLCDEIATLPSIEISSFICVLFLANTDLFSHKETWIYFEIHEFFAINILLWKNPIIIYRWTLHFSQMPTHFDCSYS